MAFTNGSASRSSWHGALVILGAGAGIAVGAFAGQLWIGLGLLLGAAVGALVGGLGAGLVAVLGVAIGEPVLHSVLNTILHSWVYLPASVIGLIGGGLARRKLRQGTSKSELNATST